MLDWFSLNSSNSANLVQNRKNTSTFQNDFGIGSILTKWVQWLWRMLDRLIETRKQDLFAKRPGSVAGRDPRIIWIKMIERPHVPRTDKRYKTLSLRTKFNDIVDELVNGKRNNYSLSIDSLEQHHFSPLGELNDFGRMQLWKEIDYYFKQFNRSVADLNTPDKRKKPITEKC